MDPSRKKYHNEGRQSMSSSGLSRSRQNSMTSVESLNHIVEENNHEIFSGATSEIIPTSISSLHYPHHFGNRKSRQSSSISRETSPLLATNEEAYGLHPFDLNNSVDTDTGFRFFSPEQIEDATGGSTLDHRKSNVDYNTDWEYSIGKFDEVSSASERRLSTFEYQDEGDDYGSVESNMERLNRGNSHDSSRSISSDEGSVASSKVNREFQNVHPAKTHFQRFYFAEEDLVIGIAGYRNCVWKKCIYLVICFSTLGLGYLFFRWFPNYRVNLMGNKTTLGNASWCVIESEYGELKIVNVSKEKFKERLSTFLTTKSSEDESNKDTDPIVPYLSSFTYRCSKFFYDPVEDIFRTNSNWYDTKWLNIRAAKDGISKQVQEQRIGIFGDNIIEVENKSTIELLVNEVLHPFYIFQVFSIFLWWADDYYYYASCIFLISITSIINTLVETKRTMKRLQEVSKFSCEVRVWRNGFWKQIDSTELVPGDVFEVDSSLSMLPCDAMLLNGECIVNESMLTGESVPVSKVTATQETVELLPENFTSTLLSKSLLYCGTKLLKTKTINDEPVTAVTVKTGFNTTKGALVSSMLFPKPTGFKFYRDSFKYIGFMTIIAAFGFFYSTYNFIKLGLPKKLMIFRALDIITIVVPPALPATLTIGTTLAINRLKEFQIFCISPSAVNVGGKLDVVCFDKTGTLTEDGLDVLGVHSIESAEGRKEMRFTDLITNRSQLVSEPKKDQYHTSQQTILHGAMATCHSLRLIDGELLGDPLDVKMFEFSRDILTETNDGIFIGSEKEGGDSYHITKEFEFLSSLRRMSVAVVSGDKKMIFTKGAPEMISEICNKETIPSNYDELLHHYTYNGFRVIACAHKYVDFVSSRESAESDLAFCGFIVFENKLKSGTPATIKVLKDAKIRTIMCTGDNVLTAVSVGKESGLIDQSIKDIYIPSFQDNSNETSIVWENTNDPDQKLDPITLRPLDIYQDSEFLLAITGDVFRYILTNVKNVTLTHSVLMKCDIYSRMSPDEKHELVEQLQGLNYTVGFCGDGANDCGALKAADVGISLSEAEASVAAPFTSRIFEISCVERIIKEGRSSLITSFSCFKYMSLYSAIQFVTVSILYKRGTNLGDFQFLYIDLFLILPLAVFMSWSKPYERIVVKRPTANLVSPKMLIPLVCHIIIILLFQVTIWKMVQNYGWYIKPVPGGDDDVKSSDNTVLFLYSCFQYILIAIVLSSGPPYREPVTNNKPFLINVLISVLVNILLFTIDSDSKMGNFMQLTNLSIGFYFVLTVLAASNLAVMYVGEKFLFQKLAGIYKKIVQRRRLGRSKKLFKNLKGEFKALHQV